MKKSRKILLCAFAIIIMISNLGVLPLQAADASPKRVVKVACGMNAALYLDGNGDPAGIGMMYIRQLAWSAGWTLEYVEGNYSDSLQRLKDGEIDIMFPVGQDEDPEDELLFSELACGVQQIGLFAREDADIYYEDYENFDGKTVGLSLGGNSLVLDEFAQKNHFSYEKDTAYASVQDKIDALTAGKVDMIAFSTLNQVPGGKLVAVLDQIPVYCCTSKNNEELYQELNDAIRDTMVTTPNVVSQCYQDMLTGTAYISYTREEHDKIENTKLIKFGVYSDFLPLSGVNDDGECVGIYVDAIKAIAKQSGLNIEIVPVEDENQLYQYMDDGMVDFVMSLYDYRFHTDHADNYLISNGIHAYTTVAVSLPEYQFDDDSSTSFVLTKSRQYMEGFIHENYPSASITYLDSRRACMEAVLEGRADATFMNTWEYNYESMNPRFQSLMEWENVRVDSVFAIGARADSDMELLNIFEKTIAQLPTDTVADIITKNLNMTYTSYTFADHVYMIRTQLIVAIVFVLIAFISLLIYLHVRKKYVRNLIVANRAKSDFLSRMSHELRTPLNAISGYASLEKMALEDKKINYEHQIHNMDVIEHASDYLLGIIKDILDIQQMETGKIELKTSEVNLDEYLNAIVGMIKPMADDKKIDFTYNLMQVNHGDYLIDALRLQEILLNILFNAVKFTPEGGKVAMTAEVVKQEEGYDTLRFVVSDTGVGMSREFLENKLFQVFSQENQELTSPYSGVGNSMALAKKLAELMEGTISCVSESGQGTQFTVTIQAEHCKKRKRRERREKPVISDYDLHGIRILMCEDNKMNQDIERRILECMNGKVEVAEDGEIGLKQFMEHDEFYYDVILMDIRMPNMDDLECAREIRALPREDAMQIPILAVSANAFESDVANSLQAGMNEHLAKPVSAKLLYENISKYCTH